MRYKKLAALAALVVAIACGTDSIMNPPPPPPPPPTGSPINVSSIVSANNDTLGYTLRWGRAAHADSYHVTVTVAGVGATGTTGLPTAAVVTDTTIKFKATNTVYDSLEFTAVITAFRGTLSNPVPAVGVWHYVRRPGSPGPIIVDSLNLVSFVALDITTGVYKGDNFWIPPIPPDQYLDTSYLWSCAYLRFSDGSVAMRTQDNSNCMYNYRVGYAPPARGICIQQTPIWNADGSLFQADFRCGPTPNPVLQAWADKQCLDWSADHPQMAAVAHPSCPVGGTEVVALAQSADYTITRPWASNLTVKVRNTNITASAVVGWP